MTQPRVEPATRRPLLVADDLAQRDPVERYGRVGEDRLPDRGLIHRLDSSSTASSCIAYRRATTLAVRTIRSAADLSMSADRRI